MDQREDSERPTSWEMRVTTYEYLDLIATCGGLALIYHGIRAVGTGPRACPKGGRAATAGGHGGPPLRIPRYESNL